MTSLPQRQSPQDAAFLLPGAAAMQPHARDVPKLGSQGWSWLSCLKGC